MLSWVDKISSYIENNIDNILKLDIIKLNNFRDNTSVLRNKLDKLLIDENLSNNKRLKINNTYNNLNINYEILINK